MSGKFQDLPVTTNLERQAEAAIQELKVTLTKQLYGGNLTQEYPTPPEPDPIVDDNDYLDQAFADDDEIILRIRDKATEWAMETGQRGNRWLLPFHHHGSEGCARSHNLLHTGRQCSGNYRNDAWVLHHQQEVGDEEVTFDLCSLSKDGQDVFRLSVKLHDMS